MSTMRAKRCIVVAVLGAAPHMQAACSRMPLLLSPSNPIALPPDLEVTLTPEPWSSRVPEKAPEKVLETVPEIEKKENARGQESQRARENVKM